MGKRHSEEKKEQDGNGMTPPLYLKNMNLRKIFLNPGTTFVLNLRVTRIRSTYQWASHNTGRGVA